jgi:hypothetical protein
VVKNTKRGNRKVPMGRERVLVHPKDPSYVIYYTPGREQPYTLWHKEEVLYFDYLLSRLEKFMEREVQREWV